VSVSVSVIVGGMSVDSGTAECAAVFLFWFVFNSCKMQSTDESLSKLHAYFGPVSQSLFADVCSTVHYIRSCLSDTSIENISAALDPVTNGNQSVNEEFGRHIKAAALDNSSAVTDEDLDWLESDDDVDDVSACGFSMNYLGVSQCDGSQAKARDMEIETSVKQQKTSCRAWLYEEVASYFCTESSESETCVDDLVSTVFDILCSTKSNDQLQTEVCHTCTGWSMFPSLQQRDEYRKNFDVV